MIAEWFVIACGIIIVCAFALGVIVGVKMGLDMSADREDDFHV